jgi:hypothetical protein
MGGDRRLQRPTEPAVDMLSVTETHHAQIGPLFRPPAPGTDDTQRVDGSQHGTGPP